MDVVAVARESLPSLFTVSRMRDVEIAMMQLAVGDHLERCGAMVQEHLSSGGKRIRARLVLAIAEALGVDRASAVQWAASVEMLHNATLVHDDIQDGDTLRRDQPTTWVRHGAPQAINTGDLMLMLPFVGLERLSVDDSIRWRLTRSIANRAAETVRGQSLEMDLLHCQHLDWTTFNSAVRGKTGQLLALPVEGTALMGGLTADEAQKLGEEFVLLGQIFQLQDDTRDLYASKGRGQQGCDLMEGKVSALVIAHLELHPEDEEWLLGILRTPRERTRQVDVDAAIGAFRDKGALAAVLAHIGDLRQKLETSEVLGRHPEIRIIALELADWLLKRAAFQNDLTP